MSVESESAPTTRQRLMPEPSGSKTSEQPTPQQASQETEVKEKEPDLWILAELAFVGEYYDKDEEKLLWFGTRSAFPLVIGTALLIISVVAIALAATAFATGASIVECMANYTSLSTIHRAPCLNKTGLFNPEWAYNSTCYSNIRLSLGEKNCTGRLITNGSKRSIPAGSFVFYKVEYPSGIRMQYLQGYNIPFGQMNYFETPDISKCGDRDYTPYKNQSTPQKILFPCGNYASMLFNDTVSIDGHSIYIDYYTLSRDPSVAFRNPPPTKEDFYLWVPEQLFPGRMANVHVYVWFSTDLYMPFEKILGRVDTEIDLPVNVTIQDRYPVGNYNGKKTLIIRQRTKLGFKKFASGTAYLIIGVITIGAATITLTHSLKRTTLLVQDISATSIN